jgi:Ser/Thr protein kinase RdoA (MazF antagonist)
VPTVLSRARLQAASLDPGAAAVIGQLAERLARDLTDAGGTARAPIVVHGDFTSHNVLADGAPPRLTGVIDFAGAHVETPLADIAYGLWRSGRPYQEADHLDRSRVSRFVRGYADITPLPPDEARLIPVYLYGRGLQMIAKRIRAGRAEIGMLAQVLWLSANAASLADACTASLA